MTLDNVREITGKLMEMYSKDNPGMTAIIKKTNTGFEVISRPISEIRAEWVSQQMERLGLTVKNYWLIEKDEDKRGATFGFLSLNDEVISGHGRIIDVFNTKPLPTEEELIALALASALGENPCHYMFW